jgi:hypothetical protein
MRWRHRRLVGKGDDAAGEGVILRLGHSYRVPDLLETLQSQKGGPRPVSTFVDAEAGEREQGDHGDEADGEHGERGENLRERQSLLLREERPHARRPRGW